MSDDPTRIKLGTRDYDLVPQPIGRIRRKLGAVIEMFQGQAQGEDASWGEIGPRFYDALQVFIPDLDPYYKLLGFGSQEAMDADRYDDAADSSPTPPQLIDAVDSIFKIHGGERLVRLIKNVGGPDLLRAILRNEYLQRRTSSPSLPSSPQPSGESTSTPSTPSSPTSPPPPPSALESEPQESEESLLSASSAS